MTNTYKLTVGLEVHAQLATNTKMFCNSKNDPDEKRANANVCPVCMGHPGTLPVINKEAVRSVLRFGVAVGGEIADYTEFDRKNYFYPDIPKGYQISQYKHPLVKGGKIAGVPLTRVHLEEDTARSTHPEGNKARDYSLVDFNRAGAPLMELVTEPAIHDAAEAAKFARELQLMLLYLGISHANMEKGEMRIEANISVSEDDSLGTKVEVKNLNSFKAVEKAIKFEMDRHIAALEAGETLVQETRGWDENKSVTFSQRAKEESHDYRYFPDPDLPKLFISEVPEFTEESLKGTLPEMPEEKRTRLKELGVPDKDVEYYVSNAHWSTYLDEVVKEAGDKSELVVLASNYIVNDLKKEVSVGNFVEVIRMIDEGSISSRAAKDILNVLQTEDTDPRKYAEEKNLIQISDEAALSQFVDEALNENPDAPLQFLVGQAMKKSGGRANPKVLNTLLLKRLSK